MAAIFQTTFSDGFSWMKMYEFWQKFHWRLFARGPINNIPALVQIMAWRQSDDKPVSEPMMVSLLMHMSITRPQWVNKPGLNNSILRNKLDVTNVSFGLVQRSMHWLLGNTTTCLIGHSESIAYARCSAYADDIDGLAQDCNNSISLAMKLVQFCTESSI